MVIYLAAKMTGIEDFNRPLMKRYADRLRKEGHTVLNPGEFFPHTDKPRDFYLKASYPKVFDADWLVVIPGWETSDGVKAEIAIARSRPIPVLDADTMRPIESPSGHWFNESANRIHTETLAILNERAGEYSDSWRNMHFPYMQMVFREFGIDLAQDQLRLVGLAALCDTKLSRIGTGGFKADSHIDLGNYNAALADGMRVYLGRIQSTRDALNNLKTTDLVKLATPPTLQ